MRSMDRMVLQHRVGRTSETGRYGQGDQMNARRRDTLIKGAARAHADAVKVAKREAMRMGVTPRTTRRWSVSGPPQVKQMTFYLAEHEDPHRIAAHVCTLADATLAKLTDAALIEEYWRLLREECPAEAADRLGTLFGKSWDDMAAESEREGAIDIRKAAIERLFASRGITTEEVRHAG